MEVLKRHSEFELLWLKHEPMMSLPGLEIDPAHRKVYCDDQEISLTAKEYDLLCLLATNKGRVLTYDQIYIGGQKNKPAAFGTMLRACFAFCGFNLFSLVRLTGVAALPSILRSPKNRADRRVRRTVR